MAHKSGFEALSRTLKDIRENNSLMGGVTVLLVGDFRQTLPVIPRGTRPDEEKACLKTSYLWPHIRKLALQYNMRVHLSGDTSAGLFAEVLLKIGDGNYPPLEVTSKKKPTEWLCERAILTPRNDKAAAVNDILLKAFEAQDPEYRSFDSVIQTDDAVPYLTEFLNTLNPLGLPSHKLILKVGASVMLLRNLNPPKLCNGTRLQVNALHKNIVEATVITGCARGDSFYPKNTINTIRISVRI
ncbi:uncharacterized protein LOC111631273 [Centruroides sculpturatus]|uniref:uncharacterized protein LOC111631273 n=1 Tax=Centruroides sculpturatus TaxID=218467 RepID=UPI000C6CBEC1|nr:uncharacterized protein LOC111631273 [Centruroides sculpturatus]